MQHARGTYVRGNQVSFLWGGAYLLQARAEVARGTRRARRGRLHVRRWASDAANCRVCAKVMCMNTVNTGDRDWSL